MYIYKCMDVVDDVAHSATESQVPSSPDPEPPTLQNTVCENIDSLPPLTQSEGCDFESTPLKPTKESLEILKEKLLEGCIETRRALHNWFPTHIRTKYKDHPTLWGHITWRGKQYKVESFDDHLVGKIIPAYQKIFKDYVYIMHLPKELVIPDVARREKEFSKWLDNNVEPV